MTSFGGFSLRIASAHVTSCHNSSSLTSLSTSRRRRDERRLELKRDFLSGKGQVVASHISPRALHLSRHFCFLSSSANDVILTSRQRPADVSRALPLSLSLSLNALLFLFFSFFLSLNALLSLLFSFFLSLSLFLSFSFSLSATYNTQFETRQRHTHEVFLPAFESKRLFWSSTHAAFSFIMFRKKLEREKRERERESEGGGKIGKQE